MQDDERDAERNKSTPERNVEPPERTRVEIRNWTVLAPSYPSFIAILSLTNVLFSPETPKSQVRFAMERVFFQISATIFVYYVISVKLAQRRQKGAVFSMSRLVYKILSSQLDLLHPKEQRTVVAISKRTVYGVWLLSILDFFFVCEVLSWSATMTTSHPKFVDFLIDVHLAFVQMCRTFFLMSLVHEDRVTEIYGRVRKSLLTYVSVVDENIEDSDRLGVRVSTNDVRNSRKRAPFSLD